jgi:hypothetical protein
LARRCLETHEMLADQQSARREQDIAPVFPSPARGRGRVRGVPLSANHAGYTKGKTLTSPLPQAGEGAARIVLLVHSRPRARHDL